MVSIEIARTSDENKAQAFADKVNGKSYMNFQVVVAPYAGELVVSVQTDYTDDRDEAQDMLNFVMFGEMVS